MCPLKSLFAAAAVLLVAAPSHAHVSVTSTPHFASAYSEFTLAVPHGCSGVNSAGEQQSFDTQKVVVTIAKSYGLESIRPLNGVFGDAEVAESTDNVVLTWNKGGEIYSSDSHAYNLKFRAKTPDSPFTALYLPAVQFCESDSGEALKAEWVGMGSHHDHDMDGGMDEGVKPAPKAFLYPKRMPGWNLYSVDQHVHDLGVFNDAEIVWTRDKTMAWSANPEILKLIEADESVELLEQIHPGFEIWVKY